MHRPLVLLSSSPTLHADLNAAPPVVDFRPNSLPPADAPSLELLRHRQKPKGGSRALQPPDNAVLGFQSASAVYQSQLELGESVQPEKEDVVKKTKRKASTRKKLPADEGSLPVATKDSVRAGSSTGLGTADTSDSALEPEVKVSKPRAKRVLKEKPQNEQGGTEKKRGRPRKDTAHENKQPVPKAKKATEKLSKHFIAPEKKNSTTEAGAIDLTLEDEASLPIKRKQNWTPPRDTAPIQGLENESPNLSTDSPTSKNIEGLLMKFEYSAENTLQNSLMGDPPLLKRKRIEMIGTTLVTLPLIEANMGQSKKPSPKKKPKTLTDFATARFLSLEENSASNEPLTEAFTAHTRAKEKNITGRRSKAEQSSLKRPNGRKKPVFLHPKLMSPVSAAQRIARQNVLFGTSSQLAHEESPASLLELQQALKESELTSIAQPVKRNALAQFRSARRTSSSSGGMWSVAASCSQDNPFNTEQQVAQSVNPAHPPSLETAELTKPLAAQITEDAQNLMKEDVWNDIDDISLELSAVSLPDIKVRNQIVTTQTTTPGVPETNNFPSSNLPRESLAKAVSNLATTTGHNSIGFVKPEIFHQPSESPKKRSLSCDDSIQAPLKDSRNSPQKNPPSAIPNDTMTTTTSQSRAATTKPTTHKNEGWTPVDELKEPEPVLQMAPGVGNPVAVKKPRGRPRKNLLKGVAVDASIKPASKPKPKAKAKVDGKSKIGKGKLKANSVETKADPNESCPLTDDIQDSQPELTPSPPRRQRKKGTQAHAPELPLSTQEPAAKKTAKAASRKITLAHWATLKEAVCSLITAAVKRAPRSSDPLKPSWYEKMLLYDPIVIEDFMAWLNDEGVRVRAHDEDRLLQPWMVQKWCEENSVCCMPKISAWNGVRGSRSIVN